VKVILKTAMCLLPFSLYSLQWTLEGRGGYFRFANSTAREIYNGGTPDVEIEGLVFIHRYFTPWVNANYVWKKGRSEGLSDKTTLKMGTLSLGSKILFPKLDSRVRGYLGMGCSGEYVHLHDHAEYLSSKTIRWGVGAVGKSGVLIDIKQKILLDLFFDYYYCPIKTRHSLSADSLNLGGFRTGGGIGYTF